MHVFLQLGYSQISESIMRVSWITVVAYHRFSCPTHSILSSLMQELQFTTHMTAACIMTMLQLYSGMVDDH
jgi:hypothetical protein